MIGAGHRCQKKPSDERGPNDISEIKQPKPMISIGVRQPIPVTAEGAEKGRRWMVDIFYPGNGGARVTVANIGSRSDQP